MEREPASTASWQDVLLRGLIVTTLKETGFALAGDVGRIRVVSFGAGVAQRRHWEVIAHTLLCVALMNDSIAWPFVFCLVTQR